MTIDVDVQLTAGLASSIDSTTHLVDVNIDVDNPKRATARLVRNSVYLDRTFVLVVKALGLTQPRTALELNPGTGTKCAMLTFVPKFSIKEVSTEVLIFVDRSGSMSPVIDIAKTTLDCILESMPETSTFNVVGYGSVFVPLFPEPVPATPNFRELARERTVANLEADMGSCNLLAALEAFVAQPIPEGRQRSVV
ncbi:hypothetical protein HDU93_006811, partial [Gonapodya sp. JEL0774]